MIYKLIKFQYTTPEGFRLNGWEVWAGKDSWSEFADRAKSMDYPFHHPVPGLGEIVFKSVDELLNCFREQPISIQETRLLETLLIDIVYHGDNHEHVGFYGYFPCFDFRKEDYEK